MRAVRRFAQQGKARPADQSQQPVILARIAGQRLQVRAQAFQQGAIAEVVVGLLRCHGGSFSSVSSVISAIPL